MESPICTGFLLIKNSNQFLYEISMLFPSIGQPYYHVVSLKVFCAPPEIRWKFFRKRPRTDDVDVIPAGDINDDELQQLQSAVAATADVESHSPPPLATATSLRLTLALLLLQTLVVQNVAWRNRRQTFVLKTLYESIATCAIIGTTSAAQPLEKL
jgi:hypothetical protein